jgi:hypothetical protein
VTVDTKGAIGALGKLKAGELANQTQVITKPLFENVPNSDRFLVAQSMISMFCKMISTSALPDKEKMDRVQAFTDQIMAPWMGAERARPDVSAESSYASGRGQSSNETRLKSEAPRRSPSDYERYINASAPRVAGTLNVALALRGLPGHSPGSLEGAMQRALIDRGMSVIPLFRESFQKEGLERRLFLGDATLAGALKLREHIDSVLVGELRFVGPAQLVSDGLYVREAVLEVHAIDPASGRVMHTLEIREKGGGANAELSSVNALERLEEKVQASISEWTWV